MRRRIIGTASYTIPVPMRRPITSTSTAKRLNRESTARRADRVSRLSRLYLGRYGTSETKLRLRRRRIRPCLLRQGQLKSAPRCPTVNPPTISERHPPTIGTKETYHAKTNSPLEHHHNRSVYCCDTVFRHS